METANQPRRAGGTKPILLGGFFLFQLVYLLAANAVQWTPRRMPKQNEEFIYNWQRDGDPWPVVGRPLGWIGQACDFWSDISGEHQGWGMFAPLFFKQGVFPVVVMEFDAAGERITRFSRFEPSDPQEYFRPPTGWHRFFNFEAKMSAPYAYYPIDTGDADATGAEFTIYLAGRFRRSMRAYLSWNVMQALRERTELPMPDRVYLAVRIHPAPKPGSREWPAMVEMPLLVWETATDKIGVWDAHKSDFVPLPDAEER